MNVFRPRPTTDITCIRRINHSRGRCRHNQQLALAIPHHHPPVKPQLELDARPAIAAPVGPWRQLQDAALARTVGEDPARGARQVVATEAPDGAAVRSGGTVVIYALRRPVRRAHMTFGGGWLGPLVMLALLAGVVLIVVWVVQAGGWRSEDEPLSELQVRFARGEIDATQFEEKRAYSHRPRARGPGPTSASSGWSSSPAPSR